MKETILGIDQAFAIEHNLDVVDVMLVAVIKDKMQSENTKKMTFEGKRYVWVSYQDVLDHLPILNIKKRRLATRLDVLCEKGVLEKYFDKNAGCYTYFRLSEKRQGVVAGKTGGCRSADKGVVTGATNKELPVNKQPVSSKEKDITKVISKKKETTTADFNNEIEVFKNSVDSDQEFAYSLRHYHIKSVSKLVEKFKLHILNNGLVGDFMSNGYQRNKGWLLRVIPKLDVSDITGVTLGKGEYLKDGRRWYLNRNGKEIEVPMDAPPRRKGTIWYKEQGRWGPDT